MLILYYSKLTQFTFANSFTKYFMVMTGRVGLPEGKRIGDGESPVRKVY
jgi:hypothetical protein